MMTAARSCGGTARALSPLQVWSSLVLIPAPAGRFRSCDDEPDNSEAPPVSETPTTAATSSMPDMALVMALVRAPVPSCQNRCKSTEWLHHDGDFAVPGAGCGNAVESKLTLPSILCITCQSGGFSLGALEMRARRLHYDFPGGCCRFLVGPIASSLEGDRQSALRLGGPLRIAAIASAEAPSPTRPGRSSCRRRNAPMQHTEGAL